MVLVERWRPRLFARAARAMGNPDDAEDVVQETLVRIYKYAHRYQEREGSAFSGWVYAIFYNVVKTYQRRRARRGAMVVNASTISAGGESVEFPDIAQQGFFERFLDIDQIASVLARLPTAAAHLLQLSIFEGKSYRELAAEEGVSLGTIRVRLYRARQSFRETLYREERAILLK